MRVLHVFDHSLPLYSGYALRSAAILSEQRRLGWKTWQVTSGKHPTRRSEWIQEVNGFEFYRTPSPGVLYAQLPVVNQIAVVQSLTRRLVQIIANTHPQLIHSHSPSLNGLAALRAAANFALPVVYEVRAFWEDAAVNHGTHGHGGVRYRLSRNLETRVMKRAVAVTCICEGLKEDIVSRGIRSDRVTVIPNAVALQRFCPISATDSALKEKLGLSGRRVLGFIGSFYSYEGLLLLLEAMPEIVKRVPNVAVLLVGSGPQESALKAVTKEMALSEHVVFAGQVPQEEVRSYYATIDVLAYPRLSMRLTETVTPLKPLEAMALRRPLIASDVGGHRELIQHQKTGLLFRAGDRKALASCAVRALTEPSIWPEICEEGRLFVERERTWEASVARYSDVYRQALGG